MQLKKVKKLETEFYASEFRFQMKWVSTLTAEELEQAKEEAAAVEAGRMKPGEMTRRFEEYRIRAMRKKAIPGCKEFQPIEFQQIHRCRDFKHSRKRSPMVIGINRGRAC